MSSYENKYFISSLPRKQNRSDLKKNEAYVSQSTTAEKAISCCTLVILGVHKNGFLFEKIGFILLILVASVCFIF